MSKAKKRGDTVYKKKGLTKPILVHVDESTHSKLKALAEKDGRSLQVTVRRILQSYAEKHQTE